jgi:hypothetical protein
MTSTAQGLSLSQLRNSGRQTLSHLKFESYSPQIKLNINNLSGKEGGPCPRSSLNDIQYSNQQLNLSHLSGERLLELRETAWW